MARSLSSPFRETIESFVRARHDLKPWTLKTYGKSLRRLACPTLADFTADLVDAHIARKLSEHKRYTAHHDAVAAKQLGQWLVTARILSEDPVATVHVPKQPKKGRPPFTDDQVRLIRAAAKDSPQSERDELAVVIALACGLRLDELRRIQWPDDLDLREQVLYVREGKTEAAERAVVLDPQVCSLIDAYVKDWRPSQAAGALFLNQHGDAFSYDGFAQVFRRIRKRLPASVDFKAHRCRNTAIVNWWRADVHPWDAQQMAGHKTAQQTREYAKYTKTPAELRKSPAATAFSRIYGKAG
jgi:integrase